MLLRSVVVSWWGFCASDSGQTHFLEFGMGRLVSGILVCDNVSRYDCYEPSEPSIPGCNLIACFR
jgi:hypothetical protein